MTIKLKLNLIQCKLPILVLLKDVPQFPLEMLKYRSEDAARMQLFPNLDYRSLFTVVVQLIDVTPVIQFGVQGKYKLTCKSIIKISPKITRDLRHILPLQYLVKTFFNLFPAYFHSLNMTRLTLCHTLLHLLWERFPHLFIKKYWTFYATIYFRLLYVRCLKILSPSFIGLILC